MITNQKVRILWITDIHFSFKFDSIEADKKLKLKLFLKSFADKMVQRHLECPIDFIFITGDLAQSGLTADYQALYNKFLKYLLDEIKENSDFLPKVITIPGNHDVNWDETGFIKAYIDHIDLRLKKVPDRPQFLHDKKDDFRKLFQDYTNFFTANDFGGNANFFKLEDTRDFKVSEEFQGSRLFGHIVDEKNKMLAVFLNTAWFSLGSQFNDEYFKYIKENEGFDNTADKLPNWLAIKDILTEYNKQITGIQLLKQDDLTYYFDNYPDYFKILVMHHPRNWLEWTESYSYSSTDNTASATLLRELVNKADVVLSGHEHMPIDSNSERFYHNILHLKGGCFMEYEKTGPTFDHSWCSILNIDTGTKVLEQEKYFYDVSAKNWVLHQPVTPYRPMSKGIYPLTKKRKENVIDACRQGDEIMFGKYLAAYFPVDELLEGPEFKMEDKEGRYTLYKVKRGGVGELCIFVKKENLYQNYFLGDDFFKELTQQIIDDGGTKRVRFLFLDLFVDGNIRAKYEEEKCDRDTIFNHIVKQADAYFDTFRMNFFNKWEPAKRGEKPEADIAFEPFKEIKFINHILPYAVAERYWPGR